MNWIEKNYMRLRFQKRVDALKQAGIPVTQQTVYDEKIQVGVPVPTADRKSRNRRSQSDYRVNHARFILELLTSTIAAFGRFLVTPKGPTVFEDENRRFFRTGSAMAHLTPSLVLIAGGLLGSLWTGTVVYTGISSSSWPVVTGVVQSSELQENEHREKGKSSTSYMAKVLYGYSVGKERFSSDRICFGDYGSSDGARAQALVRRYRTGTSVSVHYNPRKPDEAILETGSTWFINVWFSLASLVTICGLIGVIRNLNAYRIYRRAEPKPDGDGLKPAP